MHIVEERNEYEINPDVALGSNQWLSFYYYSKGKDKIAEAVGALKRQGYRIVATSPNREGITPETFDLNRGKAAIMFGTELNGLSHRALELADEFIQIPMVGFTESYNISVSAAITLYQLRNRLMASDLDWRIGDGEKAGILVEWLRTSIKMSEQIERQFERNYTPTF
jgi:tRNA (guanosine-2'-O-)-methyltransferase